VTAGPIVALVDGPLPDGHPALVSRIDLAAPESLPGSASAQHAAAIVTTILAHAPSARIINFVIFGRKLTTSAEIVAGALTRADGADIIHCSFGLPRPDPALEAGVARLVAGGRLIVAASPARGDPVWPAGFPGVTSVQGDARCGPADWSMLSLPHADFGACPRSATQPAIAGSSMAAAHLTGHFAARLARGIARGDLIETMACEARFSGRERRSTFGE